MLLTTHAFANLARSLARAQGLPQMAMVELPHPVGGTPFESVQRKVDAALDAIVTSLISSPAAAAEQSGDEASGWIDIPSPEDWESVQAFCSDAGWSDGLPVVAPTAARVQAMVQASGLPAEHAIAALVPALGVATVERIAANAVLAGCLPAHMPVLVTAVQALADPRFSLKNVQATTHPAAPLLIVSGPLASELGIHSGSGLLGPGPWTNGVIGRAIRLILLNIGGARPGDIDRATLGQPGKFACCMAENEAASPWPSLRAELGFARDVSTVTVIGGEAPHNINDHESTTAGGLLTTIAGAMAQPGQNSMESAAELLLLLSPEHAATFAAEGWSKVDVKRAICEEAHLPLSRFSTQVAERRLKRFLARRYRDRRQDIPVAVVQSPGDVIVVVAGGPGKHSMYVPTLCSTRSVTLPILRPDGTPWLPGHDPAKDA